MKTINVSDFTFRRLCAAAAWVHGDEFVESPEDISEVVTGMINSYVEDSGAPIDLDGEPISGVVRVVQFVYVKDDGGTPKWRTLYVTEETDVYLKGFENGEYKVFCKRKILDGRIINLRGY